MVMIYSTGMDLVIYKWALMTFTWRQYHRKWSTCPRFQLVNMIEDYIFRARITPLCGHWVKLLKIHTSNAITRSNHGYIRWAHPSKNLNELLLNVYLLIFHNLLFGDRYLMSKQSWNLIQHESIDTTEHHVLNNIWQKHMINYSSYLRD